MKEHKKKRLHRISIWIMITVLSINQCRNSYMDYKTKVQLNQQEKVIQNLLDFCKGQNQFHQMVSKYLQEYLGILKSDEAREV